MPDQTFQVDIRTLAVHAGRQDLTELGVHAPPIDLSSTYPLPSIADGGLALEELAGGSPADAKGAVYQRLWNPTVARFEQSLAALERTEQAVGFASGMAAMTAAILAARHHNEGSHVVAIRPLYGGTDHVLATGLLGTETTFCAAHEVADAIGPETCLVVLETPANPTLEMVDIAAVVRAAGTRPVLVDNTFATPVLQRPAEFGAAMVLHSATKYLGGHGDVLAGVVACDQQWAQALRRVRVVTGGVMHPLSGYLLHRSLPTLPLRVRAQQETARQLADYLATEAPGVERVFYPGLPGGDPEELIGRQLAGPGAMITIQLAAGTSGAENVTNRCRLFGHAVSLGGVDSLIQCPAALTHRVVDEQARPAADLLRLSIGLEAYEDLRADLAQALGQQA